MRGICGIRRLTREPRTLVSRMTVQPLPQRASLLRFRPVACRQSRAPSEDSPSGPLKKWDRHLPATTFPDNFARAVGASSLFQWAARTPERRLCGVAVQLPPQHFRYRCWSNAHAMDRLDYGGGDGCRLCRTGQCSVRLLRVCRRMGPLAGELGLPQWRGLLLAAGLFGRCGLPRTMPILLRQRLGRLLLPSCQGAGVGLSRRRS
jgi:hypothetical protein